MYKCMYSLCMHVPYVCKCALASVCYPDFKGTRYYSEASVTTGIESVCGDMCIIYQSVHLFILHESVSACVYCT